jgi:hypothetical protein
LISNYCAATLATSAVNIPCSAAFFSHDERSRIDKKLLGRRRPAR